LKPPIFLIGLSYHTQTYHMSKSTYFIGQPVFNQLVNFIPKALIAQTVLSCDSDKYYKKFKSYDHLITMLYACFHKCESIREITTGLMVGVDKLSHLGLKDIPKRSTLSDANCHRNVAFFQELYHGLYQHYYGRLSDSRRLKSKEQQLFILDSTTIPLFSDIIEGLGSIPENGRRKGGIKAHVLLKSSHDLPSFIRLTKGRCNDKVIFPDINLPPNSIIVFDRAYRYYKKWEEFNQSNITWVTRTIGDEIIKVLANRALTDKSKQAGIILDQIIRLGSGINKASILDARLIKFKDNKTGKILEFITNNILMSPLQIADIYKKRWQIEIFFKRIKQRNPLRYFLGDNKNAIEIQVWCCFIADLLVKIVKDTLQKQWALSNLASMIRHHLLNYVDIIKLLNQSIYFIKTKNNKTNQMVLNFNTS
jgi:hypothetical protein